MVSNLPGMCLLGSYINDLCCAVQELDLVEQGNQTSSLFIIVGVRKRLWRRKGREFLQYIVHHEVDLQLVTGRLGPLRREALGVDREPESKKVPRSANAACWARVNDEFMCFTPTYQISEKPKVAIQVSSCTRLEYVQASGTSGGQKLSPQALAFS
jgi:hypothetical protein